MNVTLELAEAGSDNMRIVHNFFPHYFADMSEFDPNLIINEFGLPMWEPFGLPGPRTPDECVAFNWWIRDQCRCYVVRAEGNPAGFVVVNSGGPHLPPNTDHDVQDFYIAPKYRRQGVGTQAARLAFDLFQGRWAVFQLARNAPAIAFWHKLVADYTRGDFENLENGTLQRFSNV